ncbi:MAG: SNF2 helicase associated domain-containing protein [Clostridia bacterium]|nr:SNF2 helicase associated domain-containing protein [Clostridia bacterium]
MDPFKLSFTLQDVRARIPYKTIYSRGSDYYKEGRVLGIRTETDADGYLTAAEGSVRDGELYSVSAAFDRKFGITACRCSGAECSRLEGACKHTAALLLAVYNTRTPAKPAPAAPAPAAPADPRTDAEMLANLVQNCAEPPDSRLGTVALLPVIEDISPSLSLSFRIGEKTLCQMRDIFSFADAMRSGRRAAYGRALSFVHSPGAFQPESRPLAEFLTQAAEENRDFHRRLSPYASAGDTRKLVLSPRQLDEFFDLCIGRDIAASESVSEQSILMTEDLSFFRLRVEGDRILRLAAEDEFRLLHGAAHTYVFCRDRLCRAGGDFARYALPLLSQLQQQSDGTLRITGPSAPLFVSSVLDRLRTCTEVLGAELLHERYPTAKLRPQIHLSYIGGAVFARPQFIYGDAVTNPLRPALPGEARDLVGESHVLSLLYAYGFHAFDEKLILDREDMLFAFARTGVAELSERAEIIPGDGFENLRLREQAPLTFSLSVSGRRLKLEFEGSEFTLEELFRSSEAYLRNEKFIRLRSGELFELHEESMRLISSLREVTGTAEADGSLSLPMARAFYLQSLLSGAQETAFRTDAEVRELLSAVRDSDTRELPVPECIRADLRNYQATGFRWLAGLEKAGLGGILADDMGLGKTLQMLTLIASESTGCSLIVCPASLLYNWKNEAERFCPHLTVRVAAGLPEERAAAIAAADSTDILITSYDLLRNDEELYQNIEFRLCVADEAQYIKNFRTKNAQATKRIRARARFALTGTPIENSLSDLWSIFDFILPGLLPSQARFHRVYELPAQHTGTVDPILRNTVSPFILRRLKETVLSELPEKIESIVPAVFGREQQKLYDATLAETRSEFRELLAARGHAPDTVRFLALLTRLRQICCHPSLCSPGWTGESAKLELCADLVSSSIEGGHRVLIFSQFTSMLEILRARLTEMGVSHFLLTGETRTAGRLQLVDDFNAGKADVFLISLKAGGTGLNLTGADVVIHYDPWWNVAAQNQATDRAHRLGQTRRVQVFRLIAENTVEEQILKLQAHKAGLSDALIREGATFLSSLSEAELLSILGE